MRRSIPILMSLLLVSGAVSAQESGEQVGEKAGAMQRLTAEGIPLLPAAKVLKEKGKYEVEGTLDKVKSDYKTYLEDEGFVVSESMNGAADTWDVSKGEKKATVHFMSTETDKIRLEILPMAQKK